jgi:myosin heavy subunit
VQPRAKQHFKIGHYAEAVEYCVEDMTTKNNDHMAIDLVILLQQSSLAFLASIFSECATGQGSAKQRPTLAEVFKAPTPLCCNAATHLT